MRAATSLDTGPAVGASSPAVSNRDVSNLDVYTRVGIKLTGQIETNIVPIHDCPQTGIVQWQPTVDNKDNMQCALCVAGRREQAATGKSRVVCKNVRI